MKGLGVVPVFDVLVFVRALNGDGKYDAVVTQQQAAVVVIGRAAVGGKGNQLPVLPGKFKNPGVVLLAKMVKFHAVFNKAPALFVVAWPLVVQHKAVVKIHIVLPNGYCRTACAVVVPAHERARTALAAKR